MRFPGQHTHFAAGNRSCGYVHLRPASRARRRLASNRRMVSRGIARICHRGADGHSVHLGVDRRRKLTYIASAESVIGKDELDLAVDPPPDLAVEIDVTNESLNKFPISPLWESVKSGGTSKRENPLRSTSGNSLQPIASAAHA